MKARVKVGTTAVYGHAPGTEYTFDGDEAELRRLVRGGFVKVVKTPTKKKKAGK